MDELSHFCLPITQNLEKGTRRSLWPCADNPTTCHWTYHLIPGQPVSFLLNAGLGALAADRQGLHHQAVLYSQAQLPGRLLRVHPKHATQVPRQMGAVE